MTNLLACVDASVLLKVLLDEEDSDVAHALWAFWMQQEMDIVAPYHLIFETTSVIRNKVFRGQISAEAGLKAFDAFSAQDISFLHPDTLNRRSWQLADEYNRPTAYDTYYVALAELMNCDLWTADQRLYNAVNGRLSQVRLLSEFRAD